jgi:8-oxo-dGTP diphosphatase
MSRLYPSMPVVGVGAVIVRRAAGEAATPEVLLVRRAHPPLEGEWSLPGGALEVGEKLREAVAREVLEETGLEVEVGAVLEVIDSIFPDAEGRTQYHFVIVDYLCRPQRGEAVASSDAAELRWARPDQLCAFELRPITLQVIRKGLELEAGERAGAAPRESKRPAR